MDYRRRPSGKKLPLFLLNKWNKQRQYDGGDKKVELRAPSLLRDKTFSGVEIEDGLRRTAEALSSVQKQICRGEELYYEETMPHRNVCKGGLEGFVDAKDGVVSDSGLSRALHQNNRKVPADVRWFSESRVSKDEIHSHTIDVVLAARAKKPTAEFSYTDMSRPSTIKASSTAILLHETEQAATQSIGAKRKRDEDVACDDANPQNSRGKCEEFKDSQGCQSSSISEGQKFENSQSFPSTEVVSNKTNYELPDARDSPNTVKKDDSKKPDSQRRRRSRRGAKP